MSRSDPADGLAPGASTAPAPLRQAAVKWTGLWFDRFRERLGARSRPISRGGATRPQRGPALAVMRTLNVLDPLFVAVGPLLLALMTVEAVAVAAWGPAAVHGWRQASQVVLPLLLSASVGYWTNWLALKMLFRPREPGWPPWQGVIPQRRHELAQIVSREISQRLLNPRIVRQWLHETGLVPDVVIALREAGREVVSDPAFRADLGGAVYGSLEAFTSSEAFRQKVISELHQRLQRFTGDTASGKLIALLRPLWQPTVVKRVGDFLEENDLPTVLGDEILPRLEALLAATPAVLDAPEHVEERLTDLFIDAFEGIDLPGMLASRLEEFDSRDLEQMLTGPVCRELRFVQVAGGVFGLLAGCAWLWLPARLVLVAFIVTLSVWYGLWSASWKRPRREQSTTDGRHKSLHRRLRG